MVTVWGGKELGERRPVWLQKSESKDDGVDETEVLQVGFRIFFFYSNAKLLKGISGKE